MIDIDEIFNDSYERCLRRGGFIDLFYENFIESNEVVAQKFARVDMAEQRVVLEASLHKIMALRSTRPEEALAYFKKIGKTHGRKQLDIAPELYDVMINMMRRWRPHG